MFTLVLCCRAGRHRSVGNARLMWHILKMIGLLMNEVVHLNSRHGWKFICASCSECDTDHYSDAKTQALGVPVSIYWWYVYAPICL